MKKRILYVEDELSLGKIVRETLENLDFEVSWITDGKLVMRQFNIFSPDICVFDIMLPNVDGYSLCRDISALRPEMPIIFLTAKVETNDLVKGFECGGTDYIRKPFSLEELIVRIKNQLQDRVSDQNERSGSGRVQIGQFVFFPARYELHSPDGIIKLSNREREILVILVANLNRITDRRNLLLTVWGDDSFFNSRNLDVYIRKLRKYFNDDVSIQIQTLKSKGYLFLAPVN